MSAGLIAIANELRARSRAREADGDREREHSKVDLQRQALENERRRLADDLAELKRVHDRVFEREEHELHTKMGEADDKPA